jgi:hypothetical protein
MYMQGVSTRKVKAITEELCGHSFSASAISSINKRLDDSLAQFASRRLEEPFPYLILDARYEKVREGGIVASQAVLIAVGIDWDGRRQILGVEMVNRESQSSWRTFLLGLRERGLSGIELVVADDHAGLRAAIREVLSDAAYPPLLDVSTRRAEGWISLRGYTKKASNESYGMMPQFSMVAMGWACLFDDNQLAELGFIDVQRVGPLLEG